MTERIGIIAGNGGFPEAVYRAMEARGIEGVVVGLKPFVDPWVHHLSTPNVMLPLGQFGAARKFFAESGVSAICLVGGVPRSRIWRNLRPDWHALKLIPRLLWEGDDKLLRAVKAFFEESGLRVIGADELLSEFVARKSMFVCRELSAEERKLADEAWEAARALGEEDAGQAAIAHEGGVLLENKKGTADLIERAKSFSGAKVLAKRMKPQQDRSLDMPAVGAQTLRQMYESNVGAIVIEEGATLVLDPDAVQELATEHNIALAVRVGD